MAWLLSFIPTWIWIVAGVGAAGAAWFYLGTKAAMVIGVVAAIVASYQTGVRGERERGDAARLRQELALKNEQLDTAYRIQTQLATSLSVVRADEQEQGKLVDDLIEQIGKEPPAGALLLSPARRMRLCAIRIGRPGTPSRCR